MEISWQQVLLNLSHFWSTTYMMRTTVLLKSMKIVYLSLKARVIYLPPHGDKMWLIFHSQWLLLCWCQYSTDTPSFSAILQVWNLLELDIPKSFYENFSKTETWQKGGKTGTSLFSKLKVWVKWDIYYCYTRI